MQLSAYQFLDIVCECLADAGTASGPRIKLRRERQSVVRRVCRFLHTNFLDIVCECLADAGTTSDPRSKLRRERQSVGYAGFCIPIFGHCL